MSGAGSRLRLFLPMYLIVIQGGTAQSVLVLKSTLTVNRRVFVKGR